jgi:hypothetical protein
VLLLESGQYSRANHITRKLTALLGSGEEEITPSRTEAGSEVGLQTIDEEGDIAKDLALSRIFAEREGFSGNTPTINKPLDKHGNSPVRANTFEKDHPNNISGLERQAPILQAEEKGAEQDPYETRQGAFPISQDHGTDKEFGRTPFGTAIDGGITPASERPSEQATFDLNELETAFRGSDEATTSLRAVDIDAVVDGLEHGEEREDEPDSNWSDDLYPEPFELSAEETQRVPAEVDQEYAEDAFSESPTPAELEEIPDAKSVRERAREVALELIYEYGLGAEYTAVLTKIFSEFWWSRCKTSMREQLENAVSAKTLDMARSLRELWAVHPEYHENISEYLRSYAYESLPWRMAVRLVDAYRQYPQFEEVEGFLDFCYGEWDSRPSLQRQFPSFYSMIKNVVERSEADGVDPPDVAGLFRKAED